MSLRFYNFQYSSQNTVICLVSQTGHRTHFWTSAKVNIVTKMWLSYTHLVFTSKKITLWLKYYCRFGIRESMFNSIHYSQILQWQPHYQNIYNREHVTEHPYTSIASLKMETFFGWVLVYFNCSSPRLGLFSMYAQHNENPIFAEVFSCK